MIFIIWNSLVNFTPNLQVKVKVQICVQELQVEAVDPCDGPLNLTLQNRLQIRSWRVSRSTLGSIPDPMQNFSPASLKPSVTMWLTMRRFMSTRWRCRLLSFPSTHLSRSHQILLSNSFWFTSCESHLPHRQSGWRRLCGCLGLAEVGGRGREHLILM